MGRKEKPLLRNVEIESVGAEGNSIAKVDGKVLFVQQAIPGDIVDVQVNRVRSGYMMGYIVKIVTPSPLRIKPFCPHFGVCGGCTWQHLPYEKQLEVKQQQVIDQLTRIGHLKLPEITPILGSPITEYYRNKLDFSFSDHRWVLSGEDPEKIMAEDWMALGFHIGGFFDKILDIKECHLQREPSDSIRLFVRNFCIEHKLTFFNMRSQTGFMRDLIIRCVSTGEVMLTVVFAYKEEKMSRLLLDAVHERFPEITSLNYMINTKKNDSVSDLPYTTYAGKDCIYEEMEGLKFRIGPKSFFQTNSEQVHKLYSVVRDFAGLTGREIVYDLYTGTGTIALFLASKASKVVGIEYVQEAIDDANINAEINGLSNSLFFAGDMKEILNDEFIGTNGHPDVVVLDPPRAGIHPSVAEVLLKAAPYKIVYVSCNPASQARDLEILCKDDKYKITAVRPVDMFPHTVHVENVVKLERVD
jgi:23S rRNA (uracil1939-C5)-methyltransferase